MDKGSKTTLWVLGITIAVIVGYYWLFYNEDNTGVLGDVTQTIDDAVNSVTQGTRLTNAPYDTATGLVAQSPDDLASSCGMDTETYSLARAIASEEEGSSTSTKIAVGWAIKNYSDYKGYGSITTAVTTSGGQYGIQTLVGYCSSARDPYQGDADIAAGILSGQYADPTGGSIQFDRTAGENAAKVQANRIASGEEQVIVPGTTGIEFWRKV